GAAANGRRPELESLPDPADAYHVERTTGIRRGRQLGLRAARASRLRKLDDGLLTAFRKADGETRWARTAPSPRRSAPSRSSRCSTHRRHPELEPVDVSPAAHGDVS